VSNGGGGWRTFVLVSGLAAFAAAGVMLVGAAIDWSHSLEVRTRWPGVTATITQCRVVQRLRKRRTTYGYFAECAVAFDSGKEMVRGGFESREAYYEHRPVSWGNPGIDELRAWVAQHPDGSTITIRYDPSWPPNAEPDPMPAIFDWHSPALALKIAEIAGISGAILTGIAFLVRRRVEP
jgi:Protein of unknown function (DUF3592)